MFTAEGLVLTVLLFHALVYGYPNSLSCNFEEDVCGWSIHNFLRTSYQVLNNDIGPWPDHTTRSNKGYYLYMTENHSHATLESTQVHINDFQCLTFWYRLREANSANIEVSVREKGSSRKLKIFTNLNGRENTWRFAIAEATAASNKNISFQIRGKIRNNGNIGLDDVDITPGSCIDCNEHHVFCNWDGDYMWTMNRKEDIMLIEVGLWANVEDKKEAPATQPVLKGLFTANTFYNSMRNESVLTSKSEIFPGQKCLAFQYLINDNCTTYIQVRTYEGVVLSNNWRNISDKHWSSNSISINLSKESRIAVSFVHGRDCSGQYGIGRISLKQGLCPEAPMKTSETMHTVDTSSSYIRKDTDTSRNIVITTALSSVSINSTAVPDHSTAATSTYVPDNSTTATTTFVPDNFTTTPTTSAPALPTIFPALSDSIKAGVIVGIVIGCVVAAIGLSLAALFVYRRRRDSRSRRKSLTKSTRFEAANSRVFWEYNYYDNVKLSPEREHQTSDIAYYNAHPEYDTIE